jgi:hypothetical protein
MNIFLKKILWFLPIPIFIVAVNYIAQTTNLLQNNARAAANYLLQGYNIANAYTCGDCCIKEFYATNVAHGNAAQKKDILVFGSSRSLGINSKLFPGKSFFNTSVTDGRLENFIYLYFLWRKNGLIPSQVILGLDAWLLKSTSQDFLWPVLKNKFASVDFVILPCLPGVATLSEAWVRHVSSHSHVRATTDSTPGATAGNSIYNWPKCYMAFTEGCVILNSFQDPWISKQSLFLDPKISMDFKNNNFLDYNIEIDILECFLRKNGVLFYPWILKRVQDDTVVGRCCSQGGMGIDENSLTAETLRTVMNSIWDLSMFDSSFSSDCDGSQKQATVKAFEFAQRLCSIDLFRNSLMYCVNTLLHRCGFKGFGVFYPTKEAFANSEVMLADGSINYGLVRRSRSAQEVERLVISSIKEKGFFHLNDFDKLDSDMIKLFEMFIKLLLHDNVSVTFFLTPYHPKAFELLKTSEKYKIICMARDYFLNVARKNNIKVVGDFDPATNHLEGGDFFDEFHPKGSAMQKVFAKK